MSEFKEIKTQEELDAIIGSRLQRESDKYEDKIKGLKGTIATLEEEKKTLQGQIDGHSKDGDKIKDLEAKVKAYETNSVKMRIAHELGIPMELAERLTGDDEKSIRQDAETMSKFMKSENYVAPLGDPEGNQKSKNDGYKSLLEGLEEGE